MSAGVPSDLSGEAESWRARCLAAEKKNAEYIDEMRRLAEENRELQYADVGDLPLIHWFDQTGPQIRMVGPDLDAVVRRAANKIRTGLKDFPPIQVGDRVSITYELNVVTDAAGKVGFQPAEADAPTVVNLKPE